MRCGNRRVTHDTIRYDTIRDMCPTVLIISQYNGSVKFDVLQDNYTMIHYDICQSEEYKMLHYRHEHKNFVCFTDVVKAEVD